MIGSGQAGVEEALDAMSGEAVPLRVVPAALHSASGVIGGQSAPLAAPTSAAPTSMETAGQADAAADQAINAYCAAFAQRLVDGGIWTSWDGERLHHSRGRE